MEKATAPPPPCAPPLRRPQPPPWPQARARLLVPPRPLPATPNRPSPLPFPHSPSPYQIQILSPADDRRLSLSSSSFVLESLLYPGPYSDPRAEPTDRIEGAPGAGAFGDVTAVSRGLYGRNSPSFADVVRDAPCPAPIADALLCEASLNV
ncbi:hypothetical protein ZWY2020_014705 [Hordeum vulgare]|nr:hypothetical protein ZWY2020_014705 [Hordeum vulgare]